MIEGVEKRCSKCQQVKPLADFALNRQRPDGRTTYCKSCKKQYNATYYNLTKDRHNPSRAERRVRHRAGNTRRLIEYLSTHPCVDCGETDVVVLDFDHQRDKIAEDSRLLKDNAPWERIAAEIKKCDVVCANDHRRRTARTQGWARLTEPQAPLL
ncbi:hypothetical protein [Micromonospora sp. NPDC005203]|uniref:hypothetical protein n=1 Tax=Micromonospora sp. NPDC005203 TaxID=3364226 RepID=UPI0036A99230